MRRDRSPAAIAAAVSSVLASGDRLIRTRGSPSAGQRRDGDGPGDRVGDLQPGNGAVQVVQAERDDSMQATGQRADQDAPGMPGMARGRHRERPVRVPQAPGGDPGSAAWCRGASVTETRPSALMISIRNWKGWLGRPG